MQLIDKDVLVAKIESYINDIKFSQKAGMIKKRNAEMKITIFKSILSFINTLEVKEVDLDKEIIDFINNHYTICFDNNTLQNNEFDFLTIKDVEEIAKHFFELVLKAQKGE